MATELCPLCAQSFEANPGETVCPECAGMDSGEEIEATPEPPLVEPLPPEPPPVAPPPPEPPRGVYPQPPGQAPAPFPRPQPIVHGSGGKSITNITGFVVAIAVIVGIGTVGVIVFSAVEESSHYSKPYNYQSPTKATPKLTVPCGFCQGTGKMECLVCVSGKQGCIPCGGDGRLSSGKRCIACRGQGVLSRNCSTCRGTTRARCVGCR